MAKCSFCSQEIRITKKNIESKAHFESRHPTSTFAICFPGVFDPTVAAAVEEPAASAAASASVAVAAQPKKKAEDLSFLDAALDSKAYSGRKK